MSDSREQHVAYAIPTPQVVAPLKSKQETLRRIKRWVLMTFAILTLIILCGLLTGLLFRKVAGSATPNTVIQNICTSDDCLQSAVHLKMSMDPTADPCEDFERFVCGNWSNAHLTKDFKTNTWFHEVQNTLEIKIRNIMENYDEDDKIQPLKNAIYLYENCIDNEVAANINVEKYDPEILNIRALLKSMDMIYDEETLRNGTSTSLFAKIANLKRKLNVNVFFDVFVNPYIFDNDYNVIIMYLPNSSQLTNSEDTIQSHEDTLEILRNGKGQSKGKISKDAETEKEKLKEKLDKIRKTLKKSFLEVISNGNYLSGKHKFDYEKLLDFRIYPLFSVLEEFENILKSRIKNFDDEENDEEFVVLDVEKLQEEVDEYRQKWFADKKGKFDINNRPKIWIEYFSTLLKDIVQDEKVLEIPLIIIDLDRIKAFSVLCDEIEDDVLELWVWWSALRKSTIYTSGNLRRLMKNVRPNFQGNNLGDISIYCSNEVNKFLPFSATRMFVEHERNFHTKIETIFNNFLKIRDAYAKIIIETNWLDSSTRLEIMRKIYKMKWVIGFPDWLMEDDVLLEYYENLTLIEDDTFLENVIQIQTFNIYGQLDSLNYMNDEEEALWPSITPLIVNAFYMPTCNQMIIPYGILTYPFFGHGLDSMEFGSFGVIIGHEISHGFDPIGMFYDHKGNYRNTWSDDVFDIYVERTSCYIDHYNQYEINNSFSVDGENTLSENVADNCGIKASFMAFKKSSEYRGKEPSAPGLAEYTQEQLFFISFANLWCGIYTDTYYKMALEDVHAPNIFRIFGSLRNSEEFSKTWNCQPGSYMNPQSKCSLW